jgi:hypothetical protein
MMVGMRLAERWASKVAFGDLEDCWEWTAFVSAEGYGRINRGSRQDGIAYAHRVAWEMCKGEIPSGMTIDHICLNRRCQNPSHMQLLSRSANGARAWDTSDPAARYYPKADDSVPCRHGHLDWVRNRKGHRRCAECHRIEARASR